MLVVPESFFSLNLSVYTQYCILKELLILLKMYYFYSLGSKSKVKRSISICLCLKFRGGSEKGLA